MQDIERVRILQEALKIAGKYCRENIPALMPEDPRLFDIIAGGNIRDPQGKEFIDMFLQDSLTNLRYDLDAE